MERITIEHLSSVRNDEKRVVNKTYLINNKEVHGDVDLLAIEPLRILESILMEKGLKIRKTIEGNDPCNIVELKVECEEYIAIENILKEIIEYRCCPECTFKWTDIIRQLPFKIMMQVSNSIMNYGKDLNQHQRDMAISNTEWEFFLYVSRRQGIDVSVNPNTVNDNLVIPKESPQLRKHLVYRSARGGYNIKTQNYRDSSMDHYSWYDSKIWD